MENKNQNPEAGKKKNPHQIDPTKQDERDNDSTRIPDQKEENNPPKVPQPEIPDQRNYGNNPDQVGDSGRPTTQETNSTSVSKQGPY